MPYSSPNSYMQLNYGGGPKYIKKKFQSLQLEAARSVLGHKSSRWSKAELLRQMDWMDLEQTLGFAANKLSYKIMHWKLPELLHARYMKSKNEVQINTRLSGSFKMGARPKNIGRTKLTKNQYRAVAYNYYESIPEDIQNLARFDHFKKWLKKFYKYGATNAYDKLPRFVTNDPPPP